MTLKFVQSNLGDPRIKVKFFIGDPLQINKQEEGKGISVFRTLNFSGPGKSYFPAFLDFRYSSLIFKRSMDEQSVISCLTMSGGISSSSIKFMQPF